MNKKMYVVTLSGWGLNKEFDNFLKEYFEEDEVEYTASNPDAYYGKDYGRREYVLWAEGFEAETICEFLEDHTDKLDYCGCLECLG